MKVTWLGKSGLKFDNGVVKALINPASLEVGEYNMLLLGRSMSDAEMSVIKEILSCKNTPITILCSRNVYSEISSLDTIHNISMISPHSVWSEGGVTFYAVRAAHFDPHSVGFILDDSEKTYYVSGNTVYNFDVIDDVLDLVEDGVDYAFLPISGKSNNMNPKDAADFAYEIDAGCAIPVEHGYSNVSDFDFEDAKVMEIGVETEL